MSLILALAVALGLASVNVGAADSPVEQAEMLENSLQAVDWYTNESVRKALQAEASGDIANARLFGDKAIESDVKAQGLRQQAAQSWVVAGKADQAKVLWQRAANMAKERADLMEKRLPLLQQQWQSAEQQSPAMGRDKEIIYLQGVFLAAQQWALAADFFEKAAQRVEANSAWQEVQRRLSILDSCSDPSLTADSHLLGCEKQLNVWRARFQR